MTKNGQQSHSESLRRQEILPVSPIARVLSGRWTLVVSPENGGGPFIQRIKTGMTAACTTGEARQILGYRFINAIDDSTTMGNRYVRYAGPAGCKRYNSKKEAQS